jgi:hypothetical protein
VLCLRRERVDDCLFSIREIGDACGELRGLTVVAYQSRQHQRIANHAVSVPMEPTLAPRVGVDLSDERHQRTGLAQWREKMAARSAGVHH